MRWNRKIRGPFIAFVIVVLHLGYIGTLSKVSFAAEVQDEIEKMAVNYAKRSTIYRKCVGSSRVVRLKRGLENLQV